MHRRRLAALPALAAVAVLVAACGGGGSTAAPAASDAASPAESAEATRIEVSLTDAIKIEPATITVPAGQAVTFVVTNTGKIEHEFIVGDEDVQAEHENKMEEGGHGEDEENAIAVPPGETKELTMTFAEAGTTLAGCHVTGHYAAGMKAEIVIE